MIPNAASNGFPVTHVSTGLHVEAGATLSCRGVIVGMGATRVIGPISCPVAAETAGDDAGGVPENPAAIIEDATEFPCPLFGAIERSGVFVTVAFGQN